MNSIPLIEALGKPMKTFLAWFKDSKLSRLTILGKFKFSGKAWFRS